MFLKGRLATIYDKWWDCFLLLCLGHGGIAWLYLYKCRWYGFGVMRMLGVPHSVIPLGFGSFILFYCTWRIIPIYCVLLLICTVKWPPTPMTLHLSSASSLGPNADLDVRHEFLGSNEDLDCWALICPIIFELYKFSRDFLYIINGVLSGFVACNAITLSFCQFCCVISHLFNSFVVDIELPYWGYTILLNYWSTMQSHCFKNWTNCVELMKANVQGWMFQL